MDKTKKKFYETYTLFKIRSSLFEILIFEYCQKEKKIVKHK